MAKQTISQLHFIRVLAMAGIFLHHLWMGLGDLRTPYQNTLLGHAFVDMALGVIVFNVMTAFLMTLPFVGANPAPAPAPFAFIRKRLGRICPQYYLSIIIFTILTAIVFHQTDVFSLLYPVLSRLLFLQTFQYQAFMSNMAAYWWLGLLMQFTVCYPLLLWLIRHPKIGPMKACLGSAVIIWPLIEIIKAWGRANPDSFASLFSFLFTFNLPSRLPEFLAGMWMASVWKDSGRKWPLDKPLGIFLVSCLVLSLILESIPGLPSPHLTGAVWSIAAFAALFRLPFSARLGNLQWVLFGSAASYSMYLSHQPLLSYFDLLFNNLAPWDRFVLLLLTAGAACIVVSKGLDLAAEKIAGKG